MSRSSSTVSPQSSINNPRWNPLTAIEQVLPTIASQTPTPSTLTNSIPALASSVTLCTRHKKQSTFMPLVVSVSRENLAQSHTCSALNFNTPPSSSYTTYADTPKPLVVSGVISHETDDRSVNLQRGDYINSRFSVILFGGKIKTAFTTAARTTWGTWNGCEEADKRTPKRCTFTSMFSEWTYQHEICLWMMFACHYCC